jgi:FkbM family methyltransferase
MRLNTRQLFLELLPLFDADTVCDVGSMNGSEALAFRRVLPRARVLAFEPNPGNLERMRADERLSAAGIEILASAATNHDGQAPFYLVGANYQAAHDRRGMSSLHERPDRALLDAEITVNSVRLDSVLGSPHADRLALWLDVEGKAFEALEGAKGLLDRVCAIHVEVETRPCIGANQKLYPEVRRMLEDAGMRLLATDCATDCEQFNALFVRRDLGARLTWQVTRRASRLAVRRGVAAVMRRLCPRLLRRVVERRRDAAGLP